jgi:hypothetical protein
MPDEPRRPANTMHERQQAAIDEEYGAKGRWTGHDRPSVTGSPSWQPPRIGGAGPWAGPDPVPAEESLGFAVDELPDLTTVSGVDRQLLAPLPPEDEQPTEEPEQ